jgi:hypothetical protein
MWFRFKYGLNISAPAKDRTLNSRALTAETANAWVADNHFRRVFHFLRAPGKEEYC